MAKAEVRIAIISYPELALTVELNLVLFSC